MPISIAAQELSTSATKKRKRVDRKEDKPQSAAFKPADFVRGTAAQSAAAVPAQEVDKKGKGKARELLLGEEGVTGHKAE